MISNTSSRDKGTHTGAKLKHTDGLAEARVFDLLSSECRLYVIDAVKPRRECSRSELVDEVCESECGKPIGEVSSRKRNTVATSLYQTHLPKLADHGVIVWDRDRDVVGAGERYEQVREYREGGSDSIGGRVRGLLGR